MDISQYIKHVKISRADFADKIGVSVTAIGYYMNGKRMPTPEIMREIAKATEGQVLPNDFYGIDQELKKLGY